MLFITNVLLFTLLTNANEEKVTRIVNEHTLYRVNVQLTLLAFSNTKLSGNVCESS